MKFRLTLRNRFILAFGVLIGLFATNALISFTVISNNLSIAKKISEETEPSLKALDDFALMIIRSKMLATNWVYLRSKEEDKRDLEKLHNTDYPEFKKHLYSLSAVWKDSADKKRLDSVFLAFEKILEHEKHIMSNLSSFESYDDPLIKLESESSIDEVILPLTDNLLEKLYRLRDSTLKAKQMGEADLSSANKMLVASTIVLAIILIVISVVVAVYLSSTITNPIIQLKNAISQLAKGKLVEISNEKRADEIGDMQQSVNDLIRGLKYTSQFAQNVGNSMFDYDYQALSDEDELGHSLITMRNNLKKAAEEDRRRNWASSGMAQLGEILRKQYSNSGEMYDSVLQFIIKYLDLNQGKLYEIQEDNGRQFLELVACYAYSRKKFLRERFEIGEGLVGQCVIEADKIYLTDIPEDYVKITSGLGEARPNCVLIIPLKVVDTVHGVIELASFKILESYEVDFIEKASESIASSISIMKVNERTRKLLEESQIQSELLRSQEEEMRQNMEELHATQEEMQRKNAEMESHLRETEKREKLLLQEINELKKTTCNV